MVETEIPKMGGYYGNDRYGKAPGVDKSLDRA